jgi:hypothetical protein
MIEDLTNRIEQFFNSAQSQTLECPCSIITSTPTINPEPSTPTTEPNTQTPETPYPS